MCDSIILGKKRKKSCLLLQLGVNAREKTIPLLCPEGGGAELLKMSFFKQVEQSCVGSVSMHVVKKLKKSRLDRNE